MARNYRHIKKYETEILRMKEQGYTKREIGNILGFTYEQVHDFVSRYNRNQRKMAAGITIKRKGRPCKSETELPPSVQKLSELTKLKYVLSSKERYIKTLEMENELMRDFLSLAGRK